MKGSYGPGWHAQHSNETFADFAYDGLGDASEKCCACIPASDANFNALGCVAKESDIDEWRDSGGHTCADYLARNWCDNGVVGAGWVEAWGQFGVFADGDGLDASDKCCECMSTESLLYEALECGERILVNGTMYQMQHQISIAVYTCNAVIFMAILGLVVASQCRSKKSDVSVGKISYIVLIGGVASMTAKGLVYYGQYQYIWSTDKHEQRIGGSIVVFMSKWRKNTTHFF